MKIIQRERDRLLCEENKAYGDFIKESEEDIPPPKEVESYLSQIKYIFCESKNSNVKIINVD